MARQKVADGLRALNRWIGGVDAFVNGRFEESVDSKPPFASLRLRFFGDLR